MAHTIAVLALLALVAVVGICAVVVIAVYGRRAYAKAQEDVARAQKLDHENETGEE